MPFHAWAPDAYEGASVPVTAYMATIVKAGVLLAVVRLFGTRSVASPMLELLAVLPLVSIVWGNLAAMRQPSLRRMIAYSSIAHAGYLFYALLGDAAGRLQAVAFYLLAYGLMNLLAFAALPPAADDAARDRLDNLKGLFHRAPFAALMIGIAMLSLAGIPPLPGLRRQVPDLQERASRAGHTTVRGARPRRQLPGHLLLPARDPAHVHEPGCDRRRRPAGAHRLALGASPGLHRGGGAGRGLPGLGDRPVLRSAEGVRKTPLVASFRPGALERQPATGAPRAWLAARSRHRMPPAPRGAVRRDYHRFETRLTRPRYKRRDAMPSTPSHASAPAVLDLIGNTPLVEVTRFDTGPCRLFLKLENQNPGGSIKDRIGAVDDRGGRARRPPAARRHAGRGDRRQHRPRPGAGRARRRATA